MLSTRITQTCGLSTPIISAGMAFVALPPLAAAVSNAGGMGTFSAFMVAPEALRRLIRDTRTLTLRPFGIDFITEFATADHIDVCIAEGVPVVIFFWSMPSPAWVKRLQAHGIKVWIEVGTLAEARQAQHLGSDAIIAQGREAGGHNRAEASTFSLLPAVVQAVAPTPVIAAGGIVDGKTLVAALVLGADAVWCGTRFLASREANAHPEYKARVLAATVEDTTRTTLFGPEWPGQVLRVVRNRVVRQWGDRPSAAATTIGSTIVQGKAVPLPKFSAMLPTPDTSGDFEEMCLTAGESSGHISDLQPASEIVHRMTQEARAVVRSRFATGQLQSPNPLMDASL